MGPKLRYFLSAIAGSLLVSLLANAQELSDSQRQSRDALITQARLLSDAAAIEVRDKDSWEPNREKRLMEMRDMLGLLPWPARTPLNVQATGAIDRERYTIEKIAFESLPKIYVTANLYLPKNRSGTVPAIIYVCGHAYSPHGAKTKYQRHGISLAKNGYAALVLDPIQIAETFGLHHGVYNQEMYEWYARGYSPAGVETWNAIRAIDYLETRSEINANKIGMTGRSGGAAMTWFTAAVDSRVKVAVPVMGISSYAANVAADTQRHHCDCMFVVNAFRHDMMHQGALVSPRPLMMMHGRLDPLFPVPGYEAFAREIGSLYKSYDRLGNFVNIVVETGHTDSDFLREQAIHWFDRHLMNIPKRKLNLEYTDEPAESLAVFEGSPPFDALNYQVHETFIQTPQFPAPKSLADWKEQRSSLMQALRSEAFGAFPLTSAPLEIGPFPDATPWRPAELTIESEPGVKIRALLYGTDKTSAKHPAMVYVASDGEDIASLTTMFRPSRGAPPFFRLAVYPRGVGESGWNKTFWKGALRNAMHTGQTIDSLRLWDVLRAVEYLRAHPSIDPNRITVAGSNAAGIIALYAALLDEKIEQVLLLNPPDSHIEGPLFLNVLRHLDIPTAAAMLAPRRLNFYSRMPSAFSPVRDIYSLYGKLDCLFTTMDISNILEGKYHHNYSSGL